MNNLIGYLTNNGNVVFNDGTEKVYIAKTANIIENTGAFKTVQAIGTGAEAVNMEEIYTAIEKIEHAKSVRASLVTVRLYKIPLKERRKMLADIQALSGTWHVGEVTVTDSSRTKGGHFRYSDTTYQGFFYVKDGEIYSYKHGLIVSSRKKNYSTAYSPVDAKDVVKSLVMQSENSTNAVLLQEAKEINANIMLDNVEIFRKELFAMLTK